MLFVGALLLLLATPRAIGPDPAPPAERRPHRRTLQHNHNIWVEDGVVSEAEAAELLRLGRAAAAAAPQPDVRDAFAQSAELLPGDGGLVRQVAERVARLTRTRPEQVQLTFAEGRVPGDEADSKEYHYTHVVHDDGNDDDVVFSAEIFLTEHFEGGDVLFPCHRVGAATAADRGEANDGSRLHHVQKYFAGSNGLFARGMRRWEVMYNMTALHGKAATTQLRRSGMDRSWMARAKYINSFCKHEWPEFGYHDFPLAFKPEQGAALLWAGVRRDLTVDPLAWHVDCRATGRGTESKAVLYAIVRATAEPDAAWTELLAPLGNSMLDEAEWDAQEGEKKRIEVKVTDGESDDEGENRFHELKKQEAEQRDGKDEL